LQLLLALGMRCIKGWHDISAEEVHKQGRIAPPDGLTAAHAISPVRLT
jgi:predicted nucleic acid-binding protein